MHTNGINVLDLEACSLETADEEVKGCGGVGARKDVFVHEEAPSQIFVLPWLAKTGDLEEEDTVIIKHVINLIKEGTEVADANMLGHFEAGDFVVSTCWLRERNVAVVHAEDAGLRLGDTGLAEAGVAPGCLVAAKGDACSMGAVVDRSEFGESTPAAADIEEGFTRFQGDFLADDAEFVVLELFEGFFLVDVGDYARGVDHAGAEEPAVEIVAAVIVVSDLFFILGARVPNDFRDHTGEEEFEEGEGEAEVCPVVSIFHDFETVTFEVHLLVEVHLVKCLHGYFVPPEIRGSVGFVTEVEVVFNRSARKACFLILSR